MIPFSSTDQGVLGVMTVNHLLWRSLANIRWTVIHQFVETIAESTVIPVVVSLLSSLDTGLQALALTAQWLFVCSIFYTLTPRVFRRSAQTLAEDTTFRLATIATSLAFTLSTSSFLLGNPVTLETHSFVGAFLTAIVIGFVTYGWYFRHIQDWRQLPLESRIDMLDQFIPVPADNREDLLAARASSSYWARIQLGSLFIAILVVCLVTAFFFGYLAVLVLGLYPVAEILILAHVVLLATARRYEWPTSEERPLRQIFDIERRFYDAVSIVGHGIKGWTSLLLVVLFGLFMQIVAFTAIFRFMVETTLPALWRALTTGVGEWWMFVWNLLGSGLSLFFASLYGVWFWLRMLESFHCFWTRGRPVFNGAIPSNAKPM